MERLALHQFLILADQPISHVLRLLPQDQHPQGKGYVLHDRASLLGQPNGSILEQEAHETYLSPSQ